jgi:transketolase N-terminal domain/subunit
MLFAIRIEANTDLHFVFTSSNGHVEFRLIFREIRQLFYGKLMAISQNDLDAEYRDRLLHPVVLFDGRSHCH